MDATSTFPDVAIPLNQAARCLRVPATWLRNEADVGRVPCLRAGNSILIHVPTVASLLRDRAQEPDPQGVAHAS